MLMKKIRRAIFVGSLLLAFILMAVWFLSWNNITPQVDESVASETTVPETAANQPGGDSGTPVLGDPTINDQTSNLEDQITTTSEAVVEVFAGISAFWWVVLILLGLGGILLLIGERVSAAKFFIGGALFATVLVFFGVDALEYRREQAVAVVAGQSAPPPVPLTTEQQLDRLVRERQEAEAAAQRANIEAAAAAEARVVAQRAAETAAIQAAARLPSVRVPHCDKGWSDAVTIPAGWNVQADWPARRVPYQILDESGEWRDATSPRTTTSVQALRWCASSAHYAELGTMLLHWSQRN